MQEQLTYYHNFKIKSIVISKNTDDSYKVKTFWKNGNRMYEGDMFKNLKHGEGIEYWTDGTINFIGDFIKGRRTYGKLYKDNGLLWYEGNIKDDHFDGEGTSYYENGNIEYKGEWKNDKFHGKGEWFYNENLDYMKYSGNFLDGKPDGSISKYDGITEVYKGFIKDGLEDGYGIAYHPITNKRIYEGIWKKGYREDKYGYEYDCNGNLIYTGSFSNTYAGIDDLTFIKGERHGYGKEYDPYTKKIIYIGIFVKGVKEDVGNIYDLSILSKKDIPSKIVLNDCYLTGHMKCDKINGYGTIKMPFLHKRIFQGRFKDNAIVEGVWIYPQNVENIKYKFVYNATDNNPLVSKKIYIKHDNTYSAIEVAINPHTNKKYVQYHGDVCKMSLKYDGYGTYCINDVKRYSGKYVMGKKNGKGKEYDMYGRKIFEGIFENDVRIKGKISYYNTRKRKTPSMTCDYPNQLLNNTTTKRKDQQDDPVRAKKRLKAEQSGDTPDEYVCPITLCLMKDPVIASDGNTYEREAIEKLIKHKTCKSPITREPINQSLIPNRNIKKLIDDFIDKQL